MLVAGPVLGKVVVMVVVKVVVTVSVMAVVAGDPSGPATDLRARQEQLVQS